MTDDKKKPKLNKLERRAKALRDNLKKRKQQQAKRDVIKSSEISLNTPLEIPSETSLNPENISQDQKKIDDQSHESQRQLQNIDITLEVEFPLETIIKSHKTIVINHIKR